jgi:DNA replicative helicase MCM subunit Mcm2 (Cdc46/Mcm family)
MNSETQGKRMQGNAKQELEVKKSITIKMSAELKNLLDTKRELTGETISKILERAVKNLFNSNQTQSSYSNHQEMHIRQLQEIANDLRQIAHKVDKLAANQVSKKHEALNVVIVGKKRPWQNHPQKEKIFKVVRAMHRVGANLSMIASGLNLEGLTKSTRGGEWRETDVKKILEEIKRENDYLPPVYSLPDKQ